MSLEIKWGRSTRWYGRFKRNGQRKAIPLDVFIEGTPPASRRLADRGDAAFERSRVRAQLRYEQTLRELDSSQSEETMLKRIHAARIGKSQMPTVRFSEVYDRWAAVPRKRKISASSLFQTKSLWTRLLTLINAEQPSATDLSDVEPATAEKFMTQEEARGITPKTWNNNLKSLKAVFNALAAQASIRKNPFEEIPDKEVDIIGHTPFTVEELATIIEAMKRPEHAFVAPIIAAGICTGMRLGDCCNLRWDSVDVANAFVSVKTSKTRATAEIPMFPLLEEVVRRQLPKRTEFVFPEAAAMYGVNPDGIRYRVQRVFADAGYYDAGDGPKEKHRGDVHQSRPGGLRRACLRGFHSFRVSWVTLALNASVPIEIVIRVTSHRTVEMVKSHYFKPGREDFRRALADKLPFMFSLGQALTGDSVLARLVEAVEAVLAPLKSEQQQEACAALIVTLKARHLGNASAA